MKCDKCKKKEARIHLESVGDFCLDCHNNIMAEFLEVNKLDDYLKEISIYDEDGTVHKFKVWNIITQICSVWHADEIGGGYQFEVMTGLEDDQMEALRHLHQKILVGVGYKTLRELKGKYNISNALHYENKQYGLKEIGTGRIEYNDDGQGYSLVIDSKEIDIMDFGNMLTSFEGYNFDYQIRDKTDDVLGKHTVLHQVNIRQDIILSHFETTLNWFLDNNFLSYKRKSSCEQALMERVDELELLFKYGDIDETVKLGEQIKNRLLGINHDTEDFPGLVIDEINRVLEII